MAQLPVKTSPIPSLPRLGFLAFLTAFAPVASARDTITQNTVRPKGEIVEHGVYTVEQTFHEDPNSKQPDHFEPDGPPVATFDPKAVDQIPATDGTTFGFRFKLTDLPNAPQARLRTLIKHPPFKNKGGKLEKECSFFTTLPVKDARASDVTGYTLERLEEFTPGSWTIELWLGEDKLAAQTFTVFAPSIFEWGRHDRSTLITDGFFYEEEGKLGVYYFQSPRGTVSYDLTLRAMLKAKTPFSPEIPGLREVVFTLSADHKLQFIDHDPAAIRAFLTVHRSEATSIFRTADDQLFYIKYPGKTPVRQIIITTENGDEVFLWRNLPEDQAKKKSK